MLEKNKKLRRILSDTLCCENSEDDISKNQSQRSVHSGGGSAIYIISNIIHYQYLFMCVGR